MQDSTRPHFVTTSVRDGASLRVEVVGEVDLATAEELYAVVSGPGAGARTTKDITLDLTRVTFLDSAGIRAIVRLAGSHADGLMVLASPPVQRVLDLAGLGAEPWLRPGSG